MGHSSKEQIIPWSMEEGSTDQGSFWCQNSLSAGIHCFTNEVLRTQKVEIPNQDLVDLYMT